MEKTFSPLVSIVIPVYNGSNYLAEAIDSALAQTYQNVEILVVNDGSDDGGATREIALSYGDRIRYFEKENGGVSTALNLGIEKMRGEYFSWLSHDDLYYAEKVEVEIEALRNEPSRDIAVYSNYALRFMPDGEVKPIQSAAKRFGMEIVSQGTAAVGLGLISGCTLLIPKTYFEIWGLFEPRLRMVQDYECWIRFFGGRKLLYVDQVLVQSRVHAAQQGNYGRERMLQEGNELYRSILQRVIQGRLSVERVGKYELVGALTVFSEQLGYIEARDFGREWLLNSELPESLFAQTQNFIERLTDGHIRKICLYCAGRRGIRLLKVLTRHGIKADCFSDSNPEKWGKVIEGLPCVSPESLEKDRYTVIVTKLEPEELVESLRERGFSKVLSFDEIEKELLFLPIPKRYL